MRRGRLLLGRSMVRLGWLLCPKSVNTNMAKGQRGTKNDERGLGLGMELWEGWAMFVNHCDLARHKMTIPSCCQYSPQTFNRGVLSVQSCLCGQYRIAFVAKRNKLQKGSEMHCVPGYLSTLSFLTRYIFWWSTWTVDMLLHCPRECSDDLPIILKSQLAPSLLLMTIITSERPWICCGRCHQ